MIEAAGSEIGGVDPIERRRLMQPHERVDVVPMSARSIVTIDEDHRRITVGEYGIRERHAGSAGTLIT
jgi:hypothetical protein